MSATPTAINRPSRATLHDVARLSGVSTATVARVLANSGLVKPETRDRVANAVKQLNFRRNEMARDLKRGTASTAVGLVVNGFDNPFYTQVAMGAERALRAAGFHLVLGATGGDPAQEQSVASAMLERRVSALLIISGTDDHAYLAQEREFGTPVIFVGRPPANIETDTVLVDDRAGVREATCALLRAGHQFIGVLHGVDSYPSRERVAGYLDALREHGISDSSGLIIGDVANPAAASTATQSLLAREVPPTALLGLNRGIAVGIVKAILKADSSPVCVAVDDFDLADVLGISVIDRRPEELGYRSAQLAIKRLADPSTPMEKMLLPPQLLLRGQLCTAAPKRGL